ncbi:hypothetical protein BHE74_00035920 [Ensete ventricosum]|nr:hypothetical protein BHE74_00035920 [Ensete ventricosum]
MASRLGFITEWPRQRLGNFKYLILVLWVVQSTHSYMIKEEGERDLSRFLIVFTLLLRLAHAQLWINLARFQTVRSKHLIVDKVIEFDQLCTSTNFMLVITPITMPFIVIEPISSVIHPFVEELSYFLIFALPFFCMAYTQSACIIAAVGYLMYVDFTNYMGHCNFELVPLWMFEAFPFLKYLMYTPSHSTPKGPWAATTEPVWRVEATLQTRDKIASCLSPTLAAPYINLGSPTSMGRFCLESHYSRRKERHQIVQATFALSVWADCVSRFKNDTSTGSGAPPVALPERDVEGVTGKTDL